MKLNRLKYLFVYTVPVSAVLSFTGEGLWAFAPLIYAFGLVPVFEFLLPANGRNLSQAERNWVENSRFFDVLLFVMLPVQWCLLVLFFVSIQGLDPWTALWWGRVSGMGVMSVVVGINVAHELGHRPGRLHQLASQGLLLSTLYLQFFIEHNRGHHRDVGTHGDPGTARKWEVLFLFWLRALPTVWRGAWQLEAARLKRTKQPLWSHHNQMIRFQLTQVALVLVVWQLFGVDVLIGFGLASLFGILQLETVNYIEHYGLTRKKVSKFRYEAVRPEHSWNSNHTVGRLLLFEISRHSDHHHLPGKPYPTLNHVEDAPQMPTGYPGMILMALVPPLWFWVMHRQIRRLPTRI